MLKSITGRIRNFYDSAIIDSLTIDGDSSYRIVGIDGIGPVKADISTVASATEVGGSFVSYTQGNRNIVLTLGYDPRGGETITDLRDRLSRIFYVGSKVELLLDTVKYGVVTTLGQVESADPVYMAKDPTIQISLICPIPSFELPGGYTQFEIPKDSTKDFVITLEHDVPIGFYLEATFSQAISQAQSVGLVVNNEVAGGFYTNNYPFDIGDTLKVNTERGSRYISRVRSSESTNILGYMRGTLTMTKLRRGDNFLRFSQPFAVSSAFIRYKERIGGI